MEYEKVKYLIFKKFVANTIRRFNFLRYLFAIIVSKLFLQILYKTEDLITNNATQIQIIKFRKIIKT